MKNNDLLNFDFQKISQMLAPIKCQCAHHDFVNQNGIVTIYHSNSVPYLVMSQNDFDEFKNYNKEDS